MNKIFVAINTCLIIFSSISIQAALINLTERDMYVRQGFDAQWITSLPDEKNKVWQKFPANKDDRSVRVRQLEFKGLPEFRHFSLKKYPNMTFTYVTSFNLKKENVESNLLGLYLNQIGQNWEVYVNGNLIKSQMYLSKDGSIDIERAVRGETIGINPHLLKTGTNILAFKIVGDPLDDRTGLFMKKGYYIDKLENIKSFKYNFFEMMLIAVYLFFGLYHLFLYLIRRKELYNLFYSAFSIAVAIFLFCRNELVFSFFADTDTLLIKNIELVALAYITPPVIILLELLGRNRITIVGKIHFAIMTIISILIIFIWRESLLRVVQVIGIIGFFYAIIYALIFPFVKRVSENYNRIINIKTKKSIFILPRAIMRSLLFSIPGNLIIGVIAFFITGVIDVINVNAGYSTQYVTFGFAFFLLGIAGILANRFVKVHNSMEVLNVSLEQKVIERTEELSFANDEMSALNEHLVAAKDQLWSEMELARKMQTVLLPKKPVIEGYEILPYMNPANEVGGDYYDVINCAGSDWLIIGDVAGHGFPAGLIMMMVQNAIHTTLERHPDDSPSQLLSTINRVIKKNLEKLDDDKYMTITVFAVFEEGKLTHSGLHQDILVYRSKTKHVEVIESDGMWIGIVKEIEPYLENSILNIEIGDIILLHTDGITEAWEKGSVEGDRDVSSNMYGIKKLIKIFKEKAEENSLETIQKAILNSLNEYDYNDDITLVLLKRLS